MNRLSTYGGRIVTTDGLRTVEMVDPNDNAKHRYQYRRNADRVERRMLAEDGSPMNDGSPWEPLTAQDLAVMHSMRAQYHPILDEI